MIKTIIRLFFLLCTNSNVRGNFFKISKYVMRNPSSLIFEKYDSVFANALYGDTREIIYNDKIESLTLEEFLIEKSIVVKNGYIKTPITKTKTNSISHLETQVLCSLVKGSNPKKVLEIGTFEGQTTVNIAANLEDQSHIYTLNLPHDNSFYVGHFINEYDDNSKKITQLFGDSREFDFQPFYGQVDLMFIDGSHEYEYVLSDSENALRCVRRGGFIIWHDFGLFQLASSAAILEVCDRNNLHLYRIDATAIAIAQKA